MMSKRRVRFIVSYLLDRLASQVSPGQCLWVEDVAFYIEGALGRSVVYYKAYWKDGRKFFGQYPISGPQHEDVAAAAARMLRRRVYRRWRVIPLRELHAMVEMTTGERQASYVGRW
jgi:hypothetical protein